jgi:hypothetical protein
VPHRKLCHPQAGHASTGVELGIDEEARAGEIDALEE